VVVDEVIVVFVDRDGVINRLVERDGGRYSPLSFESFALIEGVEIAIKRLNEIGCQVVVVTNQPEISRGRLAVSELRKMHDRILGLSVDQVLYCPHDAAENCDCRKPNTGLMLTFLSQMPNAPTTIWMIGDRNSDLLAGKRIGALTVWISTGQQETTPPPELVDFRAPSLDAATVIIQEVNART